MFPQIIDANVNRVIEGLRVIEEYVRFVVGHAELSQQLSQLRYEISANNLDWESQLLVRDTDHDARSQELPRARKSVVELLRANFHRVTEGLRVLEEYTANPVYNRARYRMYDLEKEIVLRQLKPEIRPGVYVISHDVDVLCNAAERGASIIQLRNKNASKSVLFEDAQRLMMQKKWDIPVIINDYLDIALAVKADGVHTGQDDMPIDYIRKQLGPHRLIGRTTHSLDQGLIAQRDGADYVSVGPIWETPSKPGRAGIGFDYLQVAKDELTIPYVAIGGIDSGLVAEVVAYRPPLIGIVRAVDQLEMIQDQLRNALSQ